MQEAQVEHIQQHNSAIFQSGPGKGPKNCEQIFLTIDGLKSFQIKILFMYAKLF